MFRACLTLSRIMSNKQTLKVLCLHGYRQNSEAFKSKSGAFRKWFKNKIQFIFISAPNLIPIGPQNPESDNCHGWWFSAINPDYFHSTQESDVCKGFDESLIAIKETFETQGPFDGILGFSQGSALVGLLCCLKLSKQFNYNFQFVILIAGFKSLTAKHIQLFDGLNGQLIDIPSLHIIGESDQIIDKQKSEQLMAYFLNPTVIYHSGGHLVPSNSSHKKQCYDFLENFLNQK